MFVFLIYKNHRCWKSLYRCIDYRCSKNISYYYPSLVYCKNAIVFPPLSLSSSLKTIQVQRCSTLPPQILSATCNFGLSTPIIRIIHLIRLSPSLPGRLLSTSYSSSVSSLLRYSISTYVPASLFFILYVSKFCFLLHRVILFPRICFEFFRLVILLWLENAPIEFCP